MAPKWKEVEQAEQEKRCELILSGSAVSQKIEEESLDPHLFTLTSLNFLEISHTCLTTLPDEIKLLTNLTSLILRNNKLIQVPDGIGELKKLKIFDLSSNELTKLPDEFGKLLSLQSLNVSFNQLIEFPSLEKNVCLLSVKFNNNQFESFPEMLCSKSYPNLAEIHGSGNKIGSIPSTISCLAALKVFDLSSNSISIVPGELGDCSKLKEITLKGNPIKDKRLLKLIDQCHAKQVMDYVRNNCPRGGSDEKQPSTPSKKGKRTRKRTESTSDELEKLKDDLKVLHIDEKFPVVIAAPRVQSIRPFIVCCIVENVVLNADNRFKRFIAVQTRLHETVCEKRNVSTIATHDLDKIMGNVTYDAKPPAEIKLLPLGKVKEVTAAEFYQHLLDDAEAQRKEKKRNSYSGIHKYLTLLKGQPLYPFLTDTSNKVISLPPLTNCDGTKISPETKNLFLEVTGNSLPACKKAMDALLSEMLKLGMGVPWCDKSQGDSNPEKNYLTVQQVKVVDPEGQLKVVYPSRTDLVQSDIRVIRE